MNTTTIALLDSELLFTPNQDQIKYNEIRVKFNKISNAAYIDFYQKWNENFKSIDDVHNNFISIAESYLNPTITEALHYICENYGIDDVDHNEFINKFLAKRTTFEKDFDEIDSKYLSIVLTAQQMDQYRTERRENRSRWQGGGFGLDGAIKGAMSAGTLNIASGALHGAFNIAAKIAQDIKDNIQKSDLFKDEKTINQLALTISKLCFDVHWSLIDAINNKFPNSINGWVSDEDIIRANKLFSNVKAGVIKGEKIKDTIVQIVSLNPYEEDFYKYFIDQFGDSARSVEKTANYHGLDILYYKENLIVKFMSSFEIKSISDYYSARESTFDLSKKLGFSDSGFLNNLMNKIQQKTSERLFSEKLKEIDLELPKEDFQAKIDHLKIYATEILYENVDDDIIKIEKSYAARQEKIASESFYEKLKQIKISDPQDLFEEQLQQLTKYGNEIGFKDTQKHIEQLRLKWVKNKDKDPSSEIIGKIFGLLIVVAACYAIYKIVGGIISSILKFIFN